MLQPMEAFMLEPAVGPMCPQHQPGGMTIALQVLFDTCVRSKL